MIISMTVIKVYTDEYHKMNNSKLGNFPIVFINFNIHLCSVSQCKVIQKMIPLQLIPVLLKMIAPEEDCWDTDCD